MARAFAEIAFTPAVRAEQERLGATKLNARYLGDDVDPADRFGPAEQAFIEARDGFYQATVSKTGWPYVQFRGGPAGFLKVLDDMTIGFADVRGNRQYLSLGNLSTDDRVAMILMDYPNQRRLKVLGRACAVEYADDPALIARLVVPGGGKPERAMLVWVEGLDWNCPQNIPRRLTLEELDGHLAPLRDRMTALAHENARLKATLAAGSSDT